MFPHGLKINISVNLAILLGIAMLLIDLVIMFSVQKLLIRSEISKGSLFIIAIETHLTVSESGEIGFRSDADDHINRLLDESVFSCAIAVDTHNRPIYVSYKKDKAPYASGALEDQLTRLVRESIDSEEKKIETLGQIWGVFWKQSEYLMLALPLHKNGNLIGGAGLLLPLQGIYETLRQAQVMFSVYLLINMIMLTMAGLYQLSKVTVRPIHSMLRRAEDYREESDFFFISETGENEFARLSKALNHMLKRISDDKKALYLTVQSLKKVNTDLKRARDEVIRAEKLASVGRLSSGIAHEIGNPLSIVIGYLGLLRQKDITDEEKDEFILRAENEINRISAIIRQLLDFSRTSDGGIRNVSLHELIRDVADVLKYQPLMSDISLNLSLSAEKDTVKADPDRLRQVFLNLALNAADAILSVRNDLTGTITIASQVIPDPAGHEHDPLIKLTFSDNGPGIPEDELGNIFDPFYTTKEPGKGTGLGLYVSFMIIESLGGKIEGISPSVRTELTGSETELTGSETELGKGTSMIIHLPLSE